jgi:hypothetical protein
MQSIEKIQFLELSFWGFVSITNKDNIFDVSKRHIHAMLTV